MEVDRREEIFEIYRNRCMEKFDNEIAPLIFKHDIFVLMRDFDLIAYTIFLEQDMDGITGEDIKKVCDEVTDRIHELIRSRSDLTLKGCLVNILGVSCVIGGYIGVYYFAQYLDV